MQQAGRHARISPNWSFPGEYTCTPSGRIVSLEEEEVSAPPSPGMDNALEEQLRRYMAAEGYTPQDASALARGMGIPSAQRPALRALLRAGDEAGWLMRLRQARYTLRSVAGNLSITGRISQLPSGKLLFIPDTASQEALRPHCSAMASLEFPVRSFRSLGAMDGDRVRVGLKMAPAPGFRRRSRGKRPTSADLQPEVRVEEILERRCGHWVGTYRTIGRYGMMLGDGRSSPERVRLLSSPPPGLLAGMNIVVEPQDYPRGNMEATGRVLQVLGWPEDAGVGMLTLIHKYGLPPEFPEEVLSETLALPSEIDAQTLAHREDWRERLVITIDPASARDFDDAVAVRALPSGGWELAVHIADVAHYVRSGSALDHEAERRGNSTYLPDRVLPMLPPRLCDELCSLREGEDRLTCLCLLSVNTQGKVYKTHFARAVIRSCRRLDYEAVLAVLEGRGSTGDADIDAMLREGHKLAALLRRRRFEQGALELDMPALRVLVDEQGHACGVETEQSDISHQLIEEFMLAANETVARALREHLLPAIYRIHEEPDPGKLHEFSLTVKSYGIPCGSLDSKEELRRVMEAIRGQQDEQVLKFALLRSMMRARYSPRPLGHYGLAKGDYCHFTSPIRRYADLIVHRSFARLCGSRHVSLPRAADLEAIAEHISETERNSAMAEQEAQRLLLAEYLKRQCESDSPRIWQAVITACWPQGIAIELPELRMKGFVSATELPQEHRWFYERHANRWSSTDGRRLLPGATLQVIPLRVDAEAGFVDCRPAPSSPNIPL